MSKTQWYNLWHSYRWMRRFTTDREAIAWCSHFRYNNGIILKRVVS